MKPEKQGSPCVLSWMFSSNFPPTLFLFRHARENGETGHFRARVVFVSMFPYLLNTPQLGVNEAPVAHNSLDALRATHIAKHTRITGILLLLIYSFIFQFCAFCFGLLLLRLRRRNPSILVCAGITQTINQGDLRSHETHN